MNDLANNRMSASNSHRIDFDTPVLQRKRRIRALKDRNALDTTLVDDLTAMVDACLSWTVRQAGAWGTADLLTGLRDGRAADGELSRPLELVTNSYGNTRRQRGTRRLDRPPAAAVAVDLTTAGTRRGRLAATGSAAAAVLQWFGLPEAPQIAPDGTLRTSRWGAANRERQIEQWADDHAIPRTR